MSVSSRTALIISFTMALGACATGAKGPSYSDEMKTLEQQCTAKDGILTPSGLQTGRPQTDYVCKITGGATRIDRSRS